MLNSNKEVEEFFTEIVKGARMQLDTLLDLIKQRTYNQLVKSKSKQSEMSVINKNDFL